ncbi:hypothetical protein SAMN05216318_10346 [Nitrosomonas eutropha]|nr:hypothetical protein SAMN05216318_10346 [Nitrosomonas eutropha]
MRKSYPSDIDPERFAISKSLPESARKKTCPRRIVRLS